MLRHRRADCCEYWEQKRKLALKRLRKTAEGTKRKTRTPDDCDEGEEYEDRRRKCDKKEFNVPPKLPEHRSFLDETMGRIKPSIENRAKYTADSRHIRCFLEAAELKQLRDEERTIRASGREARDLASRTFGTTREKIKARSTQQLEAKASEEKDAGESRDADNNQGTSGESGSVEIKKKKKKRRGEKDEFWCSELKIKRKKVDSESIDAKRWEIDCEDSICSFDSQINLSGLTLTKEEKRKIRENARTGIRLAEQ